MKPACPTGFDQAGFVSVINTGQAIPTRNDVCSLLFGHPLFTWLLKYVISVL